MEDKDYTKALIEKLRRYKASGTADLEVAFIHEVDKVEWTDPKYNHQN